MLKKKVLIIEDESIIAMELEERLAQLGYAVTGIASSADAAFKNIGKKQPDIVLMDIHIQGSNDGIEMAGEIRSRFGIPVIYLTAHADDATLQRARATEPYGYLVKPFREQELRATIEMALYKYDMEKKALEQQQFIERLTSIMPDIVYVVDLAEHKNVFSNRAMLTTLGYGMDEVRNININDLTHPEDVPLLIRSSQQIATAADNEIVEVEYRMRHADGNWHWLHTRNIVFCRDANGNVKQFLGIAQDITERKQAGEDVMKLYNTVEQSADIIFITDWDNVIEYINPAFESGTGYSKEETVGKTPRILKSGLMEPEYYQKLWATIKSGEVFHSEVIDRKKNGEIFYYDQTIAPIRDTHGNITHFTSTGKDVTERKQAENEIRRRERYFALLNQITHTILALRDPEIIYQTLALDLAELLEADECYVTRWDEDKQQTVPVVSTAQLKQPFPSYHLKPGEITITASVIKSGHVLAVENMLNSPHINPDLAQQTPFRSALGIPLIVKEHRYGAIIVAFNTSYHFSPEEIARAEQVGQQVALALWTVQQEVEIQKRLRESDTLAKIARTLSETEHFGLQPILQLIATSAQNLIANAEQAVIHLLDEKEQNLVSAAVVGFANFEGGKKNIPLGEGVAGQAIISGETINIVDISTDLRFLNLGSEPTYRSLMVTPVLSSKQKLGTISIQSNLPFAFNAGDIKLLSHLGTQAAIAIENTKLLENTKQALKETNALYRINQKLVASLEPQELLKDVVELLQENFGYYHVQIYVVDPETGDFIVREASGEIGRQLKEQGYRLSAGEGIVGHTAETGAAFFTNNVDDVVSFVRNPLLPDTKSELAVPVKIGGKILGLLDIQQVPPAYLTKRDLQLVSAAADQLAIALQKTSLYSDLQAALQMEKAIRTQMLQSERLVTMGRLLASVSHELNNPLQAIQNALFLLREEKGISLQGKLDLDIVLSETERMSALIERLRDTYRPTQAEDFLPIQINNIIEDIYALITTHLHHNEITYEFHPDPELPLIPALPNQIRQVILNLLMNAVESMVIGGKLTVSTKLLQDANEALLTVSDSGPGIAPDLLHNIFDPFVTNKQRGTGLGLTISYDIVMKHRGRITAENNPDVGALFKVWLPIKNMEIK